MVPLPFGRRLGLVGVAYTISGGRWITCKIIKFLTVHVPQSPMWKWEVPPIQLCACNSTRVHQVIWNLKSKLILSKKGRNCTKGEIYRGTLPKSMYNVHSQFFSGWIRCALCINLNQLSISSRFRLWAIMHVTHTWISGLNLYEINWKASVWTPLPRIGCVTVHKQGEYHYTNEVHVYW